MGHHLIHPFAQPGSDDFINLVRGEGALVFDDTGKSYIDAMASLWHCQIGHGRTEIADAVASQMATLETYSCFAPFTNPAADALADRVCSLTPIPNPRVFLCQSGSESIDTAIKLARLSQRHAGRGDKTLIISRERGYHGTNLGGTSAQGIAANKQGWGPLVPDIIQTDADDVEQLSRLMADRSDQVAAVLVEPVQGAGGVWPPEPGYLAALRRLCDQHGAYLIFDEVITGFGRLGSWFASQHFEVTPDMTTFAKGVTSGYQPLGGVLMSDKVWAPLAADDGLILRHGYTYSGHASACAAGLANLDIIEREELLAAPDRIAERLGGGLQALVGDGVLAGARGVGGMWAAVLHPSQSATEVLGVMRSAGVITRALEDALTFCPPLVISDAELDQIVDTLAEALHESSD